MKLRTRNIILALLFSCSMLKADVYAVVNGEDLTDEDMKPMISMFHDAKGVSDLNENEKKMIIDQGIEKKLILQDAKKVKISDDPEFQKIIDDFSNRLMVEFWMKEQLAKIEVSEEELRKEFEKNSETNAKDAKFDSVKNQIMQKVKMQKFQVSIDEKLSNMKKEAKIDYK